MMRGVAFVVVAGVLVLAGCGDTRSSTPHDTTESTGGDMTSDDGSTTSAPDAGASVGPVALGPRQVSAAPTDLAGRAVSELGLDLFAATEPGDDNLLFSPLSIAVALGMLEPGANGDGAHQLHDLLRIDDPVAWHASMNALTHDLDSRVAEPTTEDDTSDPGEVEIAVANAAFTQPGYSFRAEYLDAVGRDYGAVIESLDFATDPAAAADRINGFIAEATDGHITDLVAPDAISPDTVLALVNALLVRASWLTTFDEDQTTERAFTRDDGTTVTVPMMSGTGDRSGRGDGWVAAGKQLVGDLRLDVVLPDEGRLADVSARLAEVMADVDVMTNPGGVLGVPRFETRVDLALTEALQTAGLTAPFTRGHLLGIADDPTAVVDQALHQAWLSVDEDGLEAAAATVVLAIATSAPIDEPVTVVLDRPFLLRIVDTRSDATLFLGMIIDPTA